MPTLPEVVDCDADVTMAVSAPIRHLCPHVDEIDRGEICIGWRCEGQTIELHSLAAYLAGFAESQIGHEDLVDRISHDINTLDPSITAVTVSATFTTAVFVVEVTSAIPGEPLQPSGA